MWNLNVDAINQVASSALNMILKDFAKAEKLETDIYPVMYCLSSVNILFRPSSGSYTGT